MGNETGLKRTCEHIIPNSLLKIYPEQNITYKNDAKYIDNRGLTISDVCDQCNNGILSELDSYGKDLISNQFVTPYKFSDYYLVHHIVIDKVDMFSRWILKIIYNGARLEKRDISYFDTLLSYIRGEKNEYPSNISIFIGLHVNLNPLPEEYFAYTPLQIYYQPRLVRKFFKEKNTIGDFSFLIIDAIETTCLRFGNLIVFTIIWDKQVSAEYKNKVIDIMQGEFRFRLLSELDTNYSVRCVSSPTNVMLGNYAHLLNEEAVLKVIGDVKQSIGGRDIGKAYDDSLKYYTPEFLKEGRLFVESMEFPNNKKIQKEIEKIIQKRSSRSSF